MTMYAPSEIAKQHARAIELYKAGNHREGMTVARDIVQSVRHHLGAKHLALEACLVDLATMHENLGEIPEAEKCFSEALEIRRYSAPRKDPSLIPLLDQLALVRLRMDNFGSAESLASEKLEIYEEKLGRDHESLVIPLRTLAQVHFASGRPEEALEELKRGLAVSAECTQDEGKAARVGAMLLQGDVLLQLDQPEQAQEVLSAALADCRKLLGEGHSGVVACLEKLADLRESVGDYEGAEGLRKEAAEIVLAVSGPRAGEFMERLLALAGNRFQSVSPAEERRLYATAVAIVNQAEGDRDMLIHMVRSHAAKMALRQGHGAAALAHLRQAIEVMEHLPERPQLILATLYGQQAAVLASLDQGAAAVASGGQAVAACRRSTTPAPGSLMDALYVQMAAMMKGDAFEAAETAARETVTMARGLKPPRPLRLGRTILMQASVAGALGKKEAALTLTRESLAVLRAGLDDDHPAVASASIGVAYALGDHDRVEELMPLLAGILPTLLAGVRREALCERGALIECDLYDPINTAAKMVAVALRHPENAAFRKMAAEALVQAAPAALDACCISETQRLVRLYPLQGELARRRSQLCTHIVQRSSADSIDYENGMRERFTRMLRRLESLEVRIADDVPEMAATRRANGVRLKTLAAALAPGQALLQFFDYRPPNFHNVLAKGEDFWMARQLACLVVEAGDAEKARLVDLGSAEGIDALQAGYQQASGEARRAAGEALWAAVWGPVLREIGGAKGLVVVPSGRLTQVAFDAVGRGAGEAAVRDQYEVQWLSAARDLVKGDRGPTGAPVALGNPDLEMAFAPRPAAPAEPAYQTAAPPVAWKKWLPGWLKKRMEPTKPAAMTPAEISLAIANPGVPSPQISDDLRRGHGTRFAAVDTGGETAAIARQLGVEAVLGQACGGAVLGELHSPRILHIAAPWFALPDEVVDPNKYLDGRRLRGARDALNSVKDKENPLVRAGIAMAGADRVLRGDALTTTTCDGIVTALAISGLDLAFTEVVVLPVRDAGIGGSGKAGLATQGLIHAFFRAGARFVVIALEAVSAEARRVLLAAFYENLLAGALPPAALRAARQVAARELPGDESWRSFVCYGVARAAG